jgi:DNA-binding NarL/FixJ family response regulator
MSYSSDVFQTRFVSPVSPSGEKYRDKALREDIDSRPRLGLIGVSQLLRECLLRAFSDRGHFDIVAFSGADDPRLQKDVATYDLLVLFTPGAEPRRDIAVAKHSLSQIGDCPPFIVLADSEDADEVLAAFELGARSYIPTSVTLDVMTEAIKLGIAGGTYFPTCILSACASNREPRQGALNDLTPREMAVLGAVREGRPNKVIAQELGISESTIKVHVHRIMKKLKVQNRTQAAICTAL